MSATCAIGNISQQTPPYDRVSPPQGLCPHIAQAIARQTAPGQTNPAISQICPLWPRSPAASRRLTPAGADAISL